MGKINEKLLERKIERLTNLNEKLSKENLELRLRIDQLEMDTHSIHKENAETYEIELKQELEEIKKIKEKYQDLVAAQTELVKIQKTKLTNETNNIIKAMNKAL